MPQTDESDVSDFAEVCTVVLKGRETREVKLYAKGNSLTSVRFGSVTLKHQQRISS